MLIKQLSAYKVDIVALQEIRWTGSRIMEKQDYTLFYSCDNIDHILGTGILVSKKIKHLITNFKPTTPRICTLRTGGKFFNYSVVKAMRQQRHLMKKKMGIFMF
jgi:exonuclease III